MLIVSTFKVDVKTSYLVRSLYSLINILLIDVSEKLLTFSSIVPAIRPSFAQVYSGKYDCFSEIAAFLMSSAKIVIFWLIYLVQNFTII